MKVKIFKIKKSDFIAVSRALIMFSLFFAPLSTFSQESKITAEVDSNKIKIGEQIIYELSAETNSENLVVFPESKNFSPFEVIEAFEIDTTKIEDRFHLLKKYALTKFDSGQYFIPKQKVIIGGKDFFTDSISIEINNVAVDTTKQKLFPIKPGMEIPKDHGLPDWIWWVLGTLILVGVIAFLFFRRKKKKEETETKLPPYEQALVELEQLDRSALLENRELKEYYSQLAAVVRRYLDGKVYDHALESTTGELITFLELKKDAGELLVDDQTISDLKIILQRADLAKFANSKPDVITAKTDRASAEKIINITKTAVLEPTEDELLKDQKYQEELERRRKKKRITFGIIAGFLVILIGISVLIANFGITNLRDSVFGNNTRELLEGEWITSSYGTPSVTITTPEVLIRELFDTEKTPPNPRNFEALGMESFSFKNIHDDLFIRLATMVFGEEIPFDLETTVENVAKGLKEEGAKNILVKDEIFTTVDGIEGLKISGSFAKEDPETNKEVRKKYLKLHFVYKSGFQSIFISYNENDEHAEEIAQRVVNSVQFNNEEE